MMVVVAICFTSCGNKSKVSEIEEVTEDSVATASLQTAEATIRTLSKQIEAKDATKLQKTIEAIKVRVDELTKTNPTIAQEYVADVQNFLKENASKVKAVTGNNAAVTATMEAIINAKPQSTVKNLVDSVDQDAKEAKDAKEAASNAQVDVAKVAVKKKTYKAKETTKVTVEKKTKKAEETAKPTVVEVKTQKAKDTAKPAVVEAKTQKAEQTAKPAVVEAKTQKVKDTAKPAIVEAKTQKAKDTAKPAIVEAKTQKAKDTAEAKVNEAIDKVTAEPAATVDAYYPEEEDDLAQNTFTTKVAINMSAPTAMKENGVEIKVSGGHVTANHGSKEGICYVVSGTTTNGSLTILGDKKYELKLAGVDINNPDSAAINLLSKRRAFIVVEGSNKISDGAMSENNHKGAFYGNGKMLFNGKGLLEVYGNYHNGIHSTDYILFSTGNNIYVKTTQRHGIKANNGIIINGGIINVETSGEGAKGLNSEEDIIVNGGRTTVICTGNGIWDKKVLKTKGAACLKADSVLTINGGEIYAKATGSGGKGLKAGWECYINGGIVHVITEGNLYYNDGSWESFNYMANTPNVNDNYTSSPKGIKVGTKNAYGILEISGGSVMVSANGDGINSSGDLTISGGSVVTVSTSKDGIDANGNMYLNGGTLIAFGGKGDTDVDIDEQKRLYINGTSIFSIGGRIDSTLDSTSQGIITTSGSVSAGQTVTVSSDDNATLATFTMPPYSQQNRTVLISTPDMTSGMNYTVNMASSVTATATETISGPE